MDRLIVQMGALPLDTDILHTNRYALVGLGMALQAMFGSGNVGPYMEGLPCVPGTGLTVNIGPGAVYVRGAIDATAYGTLPADTTDQIIQQGNLFGQNPLSCPAPGTVGQSINYLIEVQFQQTDTQPIALMYYNSANPLQPLLGAATNSQRSGVCALRAKAGTAAATGTQTTPAADAGWNGLYVVTVAYGATSIISGNIVPVVNAPFIAGMMSSHHSGAPGQAPKIHLDSEVQGVLPPANLPVPIPYTNLPGDVGKVTGTFTPGHIIIAADTYGTGQDGGLPGAAAAATYLDFANANNVILGAGIYNADTRTSAGGPFSPKLPGTPALGTTLVFGDAEGTWGVNNLTIQRNGNTIMGQSTDAICDVAGLWIQFEWNGSDWRLA